MAVTLENMVHEVLSELGDPDGKFFDSGADGELARWINYAIQFFCRKVHLLKSSATYSWSSGTQEVSISTIISDSRPQIERATWEHSTTGTVPLFVSQWEVWDREPDRHITSADEENTPERLYINIHAAKIGLHPTPGTSGTLTLYYSYEPANMTSLSTEIDSNLDRWYVDICQYAVARGKRKDVEHFSPDEADRAMMAFHNVISEARIDLAKRSQTGLIINFVQDYDDP